MKAPEGVPSRRDLHVMLAKDFNYIGAILMKEVVMQGIEEVLA